MEDHTDTEATGGGVVSPPSDTSDASGTNLGDAIAEGTRTSLLVVEPIEILKERILQDITKVLSTVKDENSWTDEEGHYKPHVLPLLRLVLDSYGDDVNGTVEQMNDYRREIGIWLVNEGLVRNMCSGVNDIIRRDWADDEELRKILFTCCSAIQNHTDGSEAVVEEVVKVTTFLESLHHVLEKSYRDYLDKNLEKKHVKLVHFLLDIVYNCSQHETSLSRLNDNCFIEVLEPYLQTDDEEYELVSLAALASIINENQCQIIANNERAVKLLVLVLSEALADQCRRCEGFSARECALIVRQLARNDANKKLLVDTGVLDPLVEMIKIGTDEERLEAVKAIRVLAFDEANQDRMVSDMEPDVAGVLIALKDKHRENTSNTDIRHQISEECTKALWNMRKTLLETDRYKTIGKELFPNKTETSQFAEASRSHVMISYQWGSQTVVKNVYKRLTEKGLKVWLDIECMEGSTLQAMAEAVENADIVVVCASKKYKDSPNCRAEAEYAFEKRKTIIPCVMEHGYRPDGWLGIIFGSKLWYDFSGKYPFEQKIVGLLKVIQKHFTKGEGTHALTEAVPVNEPVIIPDVVDGRMTSSSPHRRSQNVPYDVKLKLIRDWKQSDVNNWILKERLPKEQFGNLTGEDIALLAQMHVQAPESFYRFLQNLLQLEEMSQISRFTWALDDLYG